MTAMARWNDTKWRNAYTSTAINLREVFLFCYVNRTRSNVISAKELSRLKHAVCFSLKNNKHVCPQIETNKQNLVAKNVDVKSIRAIKTIYR